MVTDPFHVIGTVEQKGDLLCFIGSQRMLHQLGKVSGDLFLAVVHVFFPFVQLLQKFLCFFVVAVIHAQGTIHHFPCFFEHLADGGGRLGKGDGRRFEQPGFQPLELGLFVLERQYFFADLCQHGDERDQDQSGNDIENGMGVGNFPFQ